MLSPFLFSIYLDDLANLNDCSKRRFVIIYADDILLITQSLSDLQILLSTCEKELCLLDMVINIKKSFCSRIGPWCHINCARILSHDGQPILWTKEVRYLGVFIVSSRAFKCSLSHAKHSFFLGGGAVNGIFGKILNLASETVIVELIKPKCMPVLLYDVVLT